MKPNDIITNAVWVVEVKKVEDGVVDYSLFESKEYAQEVACEFIRESKVGLFTSGTRDAGLFAALEKLLNEHIEEKNWSYAIDIFNAGDYQKRYEISIFAKSIQVKR